ncbi:MAG: ATP-binding domain-containing protein, partial [Bacteroidetes bacterium]|nr:ATP-binding domain-containing protein [Bacteroidota bacterium]
LKHLNNLLNKYNLYKDGSLYDFYVIVKSDVNPGVSELTNRGVAKPFYESHSYQQMAVCVTIVEDKSYHRTIHKAKGAEFDSVLHVLSDEKDLDFIIAPNLDNEEHRVNYVAVSRAINWLFINVPNISQNKRTLIENIGYDIIPL